MSRLRVVVAEFGARDADGAHVVARQLRDAGVEVVHAGGLTAAEHVVAVALQEDADAVVVGGRVAEVAALLAAEDADDVRAIAYDDALTWADTAHG
ncbi:hypothetical protein [Actinokineospora bangkokensis]|uniref:B12-binding domain-containing protein n=1 Tax=Actinokineospora bangkokensis TaxID=1193682 RepID=A0A1Q9LET8_9PSEU|nr:hypothetical protein [Actinokineospora bangkokensis]OLR90552.1 hypothetical protein BJP25_28410 [Actinokineospora bangkokensis]